MKKLMVAVAAVAMVGAAFAECEELACATAYRIKLSGKTCIAKAKAGDASKCEEGSCWLKPGSLRIAGYFYGASEEAPAECEACACQEDFTKNSIFWDANKRQVLFTPALDVLAFLRNGGSKDKAEVGITLAQVSGSLYLAGFARSPTRPTRAA